MTYLIGFILVISLIVLVHEGGHFVAARLCGIRVDIFSIGFGRELLGYTSKKTGTRFRLSLIPLGGYVRMFGDADEASSRPAGEEVAALTEEEKKVCFHTQPVWKRFAVIFGGPFMNYVFTVLILTGFAMTVGVVTTPALISSVIEGSPAARAGLMAGDKVLKVDGKDVESWSDLLRMVMLSPGNTIEVAVERDKKELSFRMQPEEKKGEGRFVIGVMSEARPETGKKLPLFPAFVMAVEMAYAMTVDTLTYLGQVLSMKRSGKDMAGPVGIAQVSGKALSGGFEGFILFVAQVSLGIGLLNLLPVPLLDGGHLLLLMVEGVRRKPLGEKFEKMLSYLGGFALLFLFVYTFWNDMFRIFSK